MYLFDINYVRILNPILPFYVLYFQCKEVINFGEEPKQ